MEGKIQSGGWVKIKLQEIQKKTYSWNSIGFTRVFCKEEEHIWCCWFGLSENKFASVIENSFFLKINWPKKKNTKIMLWHWAEWKSNCKVGKILILEIQLAAKEEHKKNVVSENQICNLVGKQFCLFDCGVISLFHFNSWSRDIAIKNQEQIKINLTPNNEASDFKIKTDIWPQITKTWPKRRRWKRRGQWWITDDNAFLIRNISILKRKNFLIWKILQQQGAMMCCHLSVEYLNGWVIQDEESLGQFGWMLKHGCQ